jgi:hypothetical protein
VRHLLWALPDAFLAVFWGHLHWQGAYQGDDVCCLLVARVECDRVCRQGSALKKRNIMPMCNCKTGTVLQMHLLLPQVNLQAAALVAIFRRESRDAILTWLERALPKRLPLLPGRWAVIGQCDSSSDAS